MQVELFIGVPRAFVLRLAPSCIFTMFLDTCEILKAKKTSAHTHALGSYEPFFFFLIKEVIIVGLRLH